MTFEQPQFPPVAGRLRADEPLGMAYGLTIQQGNGKEFEVGIQPQEPSPEMTSGE